MRRVSIPALRRIVIHAQGYASRARSASTREVETAIRRLSCVQLDSISTVERSHRIALASRVGDYPRDRGLPALKQGRVFEYWAHEACLIPVEDWPLFAGAMLGGRPPLVQRRRARRIHISRTRSWRRSRRAAPLASRHFEGRASGGMWNWKPAKAMLERLWNRGDLVDRRPTGFQRLYDLPERVIPREVLEAPSRAGRERCVRWR